MSHAMHGGLVLLVEDDDETRETLKLLLDKYGWEVMTASNGSDAIGLVRNGIRPAVIVTDYMMPGVDGLSMLGEIQREPSTEEVATVLLTAVELAAVPDHVDAYLRKPIHPAVLDRTLHELIEADRGPGPMI